MIEQSYLIENPMYEKRLKMDKDKGYMEAQKQEVKRKQDMERRMEKDREQRDREKEEEKRKERERKVAEERSKHAKAEMLKAKRRAEVLAITRGDSDEELPYVESPPPAPVLSHKETAQERIKRELLEKTRAKKSKENTLQKDVAQKEAEKIVKEAREIDRVCNLADFIPIC